LLLLLPSLGAVADSPEECASPLVRMDRAPSVEEFRDLWRRDGAVLFNLRSKAELIKEAFKVNNDFLGAVGLTLTSKSPYDGSFSCNRHNRTGGVSPLRIRHKYFHSLAPADQTVQGPHQEGAGSTRGNRRALAFICEAPADVRGGTAIFDMQRAWELLPEDLKKLLARSNFAWQQVDGSLTPVPAVVKHEVTGAPCIQFFCFGRLARDCVDVYRTKTGRYLVKPEFYLYEIHADKDLLLMTEDGKVQPFLGLDLYNLLTSIYDAMVEVSWERGDVLLLDNVRFAHARLEGKGIKRKVHFATYGPADGSFDLLNFSRP